jgi:nucleolin
VYQAATGGSREARPAREGSSIPKPTIYIGNLFFDVTENDLVKELARFGTITNCRLMRDSRGLSKGYVRNGRQVI